MLTFAPPDLEKRLRDALRVVSTLQCDAEIHGVPGLDADFDAAAFPDALVDSSTEIAVGVPKSKGFVCTMGELETATREVSAKESYFDVRGCTWVYVGVRAHTPSAHVVGPARKLLGFTP